MNKILRGQVKLPGQNRMRITKKERARRCPTLMSRHAIYVQTKKKKHLDLTIGGHAYLLPNTTLVIRCPVEDSPKPYISWYKDGRRLSGSKRLHISRNGSLKIHSLGSEDMGMYSCAAGPATNDFTLQLIGDDTRWTSKPSTTGTTDNPLAEYLMMPKCQWHDMFADFSTIKTTLIPPGGQQASLPPWVEERMSTITLQADRKEIEQEQASSLISSLLKLVSDGQLWITEPRPAGGKYGEG